MAPATDRRLCASPPLREPAVALNTSTESSEKTRSRVVYEVLVEVLRSDLRPAAPRPSGGAGGGA